jgi:hypothetical protein
MKKTLIIPVILIFFFLGCSKKGTLNHDYWIKHEAGSYTVQSVQTITYEDNLIKSDSTISGDNTVFILSGAGGDGTGFPMEINGTWKPYFYNNSFGAYAWTVENDDKRLTLGYTDPSVGFFALASLTVDNMGKKNQKWHYVWSYTADGVDNYMHQIITVKSN